MLSPSMTNGRVLFVRHKSPAKVSSGRLVGVCGKRFHLAIDYPPRCSCCGRTDVYEFQATLREDKANEFTIVSTGERCRLLGVLFEGVFHNC